jgi:Zn ribbon nucleic-acid-binding protein
MSNCCPKCGSDDWDWANIGFTDVVLCTNCGHLYPSTGDDVERVKQDEVGVARERERSDRWPFPTINKPLKPLTPKEVKQYNKAKVQSLGDSPM